MKGFKQFLIEKLLNEGLGKVKKQYHRTGRLSDEGFEMVADFARISAYGILRLNLELYAEWFANFYIKNEQYLKNSEADFVGHVKELVYSYHKLKVRGGRLQNLPTKTRGNPLTYLKGFVEDEQEKFYNNIKPTIYPQIKERKDYYYLRKGPIEVFDLVTHDAARAIGRGTKWCISATDPGDWNSYVKQRSIFRVIIDHRETSNSRSRKVAVEYQNNKPVTFWAKDDDELTTGREWYKTLGLSSKDLMDFDSEGSYIEYARKTYNILIELKPKIEKLMVGGYDKWKNKYIKKLKRDEGRLIDANLRGLDTNTLIKDFFSKSYTDDEFNDFVELIYERKPPKLLVSVITGHEDGEEYTSLTYRDGLYPGDYAFYENVDITDYVGWIDDNLDINIHTTFREYFEDGKGALPKPPGA